MNGLVNKTHAITVDSGHQSQLKSHNKLKTSIAIIAAFHDYPIS